MPQNLMGWTFIIILIVVILLFGAPKLPALSKSIADSLKIFRKEMKDTPPSDENSTDGNDSEPKP